MEIRINVDELAKDFAFIQLVQQLVIVHNCDYQDAMDELLGEEDGAGNRDIKPEHQEYFDHLIGHTRALILGHDLDIKEEAEIINEAESLINSQEDEE